MLYFAHFRRACFSLSLSVILSLALGVPPLVSAEEESAPAPELDLEHLTPPPEPPSTETAKESPKFAPGQLIVKLKPGASLTELEPLNQQFGVTATDPVFPKAADPKDHLATLKQKLSTLAPGHEGWHWYADKDSREAKDYDARIAKEREELQQQIQAQEELIEHLAKRQQRAPEGTTAPALDTTYLLKAPESADIPALAKAYAQHPAVEYAEPDYVVKVQLVPNDPYYNQKAPSWMGGADYVLWGVRKLDGGRAWDATQGEGIIVAVLDTGVDYTHPDLAANIWTNGAEIPGNGRDDDGDGYVDDVHGRDFANNDGDPMDDHGHGTHVAGTIAAVGNNGLGVIGVAPKAKIMAVKGLDRNGSGSTSTLLSCMYYAIAQGADVINCSFGGFSSGVSQSYQNVIRQAAAAGVVVVAAAGNSDSDAAWFTPANVPEALTVAATTPRDAKAGFSNYGGVVDVAAPGTDILSLRARGTSMGFPINAGYTLASGTSMAAPHVAGVVALLMAKDPRWTATEIMTRVAATADPFASAPGVLLGAGRVNASAALTASPKPILLLTGATLSDTSGDGVLGSPTVYERLTLVLTLKNLWQDAAQVTATLSTSDPMVYAIPTPRASFGPIPGGGQADNRAAPFVVHLRPLGTSPAEIPISLGLIVRADGTSKMLAIPLSVGIRTMTATASTHLNGPARAAGRTLVWVDSRHGDPANGFSDTEIYAAPIDDAKAVKRVTTHPAAQWEPDIAGTTVVWSDNRRGWGIADLYMADLAKGGSEQLLAQNFLENTTRVGVLGRRRLALSTTAVVWAAAPAGQWEIFGYPFSASSAFSAKTAYCLSNHPAEQVSPAIYDNLVVWQDSRNGRPDIYLYDLKRPQDGARRITTDPAAQTDPAIGGRYIAWVDARNDKGDIYAFDLTTNREQPVVIAPDRQVMPTISGSYLAWEDWRDGGHIYLYDFRTGEARRVTSLPGNERPSLSERALVWHRGDSVLALPLPITRSVTLLTPKGGERVETGKPLTVRWKLEDNGLKPGAKGGALLSLTGPQGFFRPIYTNSLPSVVGENEFTWTIPLDVLAQSGYKVLIEAVGSDPTTEMKATSQPFEILPSLVDLTAHGPYGWPPTNGQWTAMAGAPVQFTVTVNNQDASPTTSPCAVEFLLDGQPYARVTVARFLAKSSTIVSAPSTWTATAGTHTVKAVVNGDRKIMEREYANNTAQATLVVQPRSQSTNRPPRILYAGAFRWWSYLYAYTFAYDPEDGYIYNWGQYRWSVNGAAYSGWYLFRRFFSRGPVWATVTVTDRQGASASRSVTAY